MEANSELSRRRLLALGTALLGATAVAAATTKETKDTAPRATSKSGPGSARDIAMLVYPEMTLLDLLGPFHFLSFLPGAKIHLVTNQPDLRPLSGAPGPAIQPTSSMANCPRDLFMLFAPGGADGTLAAARDAATIEFMRDRGSRAQFISSVCTGSLILGVAGLLRGKRATSHWLTVDNLRQFGATPVRQRIVHDGNVITAAGVSAGLDLGVALLDQFGGRKTAESALLITEYAPEPPLTGGSIETAKPEVRSAVSASFAPFMTQVERLRPA